ncbi:uncharacterized protein DUF2628 [Variovorax sp. 54]|nr:uncharacterized protein DUF2628 [Variovorax sp. 54]
MKTYKIFKDPIGDTQAIKDGWCWPAAIFGVLWALFKGLWWVGFGWLAIAIFIVAAADDIGISTVNVLINLLSIVVPVGFGFTGNALHARQLVRDGYEQVDVVEATNEASALALYRSASATKPETL